MATKSEREYNKKYYQKHKKEMIKAASKRQSEDKKGHAAYQREYYADNPSYRTYKKKYAANYRKTNPIKSKAKKYRKVK